jgi:hypothetical protein
VVILRYSLELRSPGCMHFVLESVAADPPFLLENRSPQPLCYRQGRVAGLPFVDLPPYSATGFAWPVPDRGKSGSQASAGSSRPQQLDFEPNEVPPPSLVPSFTSIYYLSWYGGAHDTQPKGCRIKSRACTLDNCTWRLVST